MLASGFTPGEGSGSQWCPAYGGQNELSYDNIYACLPLSKGAGETPFDSYPGFQCVELANRFLFNMTGDTVFGERLVGGNFVATAAKVGFSTGSSGTAGSLPAAGDIISMWGGTSKQPKDGADTHVAVVTAVTATGSGWSITTLGENDTGEKANHGQVTIYVSDGGKKWSFKNGFYNTFQWLDISGGRWRGTTISLPSEGLTATEGPVACPSPTACAAAFSYAPKPGAESARLVWGYGVSWSTVKLPEPAHTVNVNVPSLACASAQKCVAVVNYARSAPYNSQTVLLSGHNASWTTVHKLSVPSGNPDSATLSSVTCAPGGKCLAVGSYINKSGDTAGLLLWGYGSSWSPAPAPPPAQTSVSPQLWTASCASAATCVAFGYAPGGPGEDVLVSRQGSSWTSHVAPIPATDEAADPPGQVACESAGKCLAVEDSAKAGGGAFADWLESGYGNHWTRVKLPVPGNGKAGSAYPVSVACVTGSRCLVAGGYTANSGRLTPLLLTGHDTAWTATQAPLPADADPTQNALLGAALSGDSESCTTTGLCAAVGYYTSTSGIKDLLVWGYGSGWTAGSVPNSTQFPNLNGVACASSSADSACALTQTGANVLDGTLIWGPG